ncbi:MAG: type III-B CRISPR module RAMP protein Cmr4 [Opitutales bacterium]
MKTNLLYLFTRTPLHVGAGASVGAVDQPIQRERHTGIPIIPGSSLKGVFRDAAQTAYGFDESGVLRIFGKADAQDEDGKFRSRAGIASFAEARLLLFPLRSAKGAFALVTCPLALSRFARDAGRSEVIPSEPDDMTCLAGKAVVSQERVVLEEYAFKVANPFPTNWSACLCGLLDDEVLKHASEHLVLLSNGDFSHFVQTACPVNQHVSIDDETGTAKDGALFNEETVPAESLFYCALHLTPRDADDEGILTSLVGQLEKPQLLQFGGNATSGLGYATVTLGPKA